MSSAPCALVQHGMTPSERLSFDFRKAVERRIRPRNGCLFSLIGFPAILFHFDGVPINAGGRRE